MPDIQDVKPFFCGRLCEVDQGNDILVTPFDCLLSPVRKRYSPPYYPAAYQHRAVGIPKTWPPRDQPESGETNFWLSYN